MTRNATTRPDRWALQDAKARLSELIRLVEQNGPQHVTSHGRDVAVILTPEDYQRLVGQRTGRDLVEAMQACPDPDAELISESVRSPVRPPEF